MNINGENKFFLGVLYGHMNYGGLYTINLYARQFTSFEWTKSKGLFMKNILIFALVLSTIVASYADKIKIEIISIQVHSDGDGDFAGAGEFSYTFKVDNDIIIQKSQTDPVSAHDGETISINETKEITRGSGETFTVYGSVVEVDDTLTFQNDVAGDFSHEYSKSNSWNPGSKSVRLTGDGVDVTVNYKITVIG